MNAVPGAVLNLGTMYAPAVAAGLNVAAGGVGYVSYVAVFGKRMGNPSDYGTGADDPLAGTWISTKSSIIGPALEGAIARRRGCYALPSRRTMLDLTGRLALWEQALVASVGPTDRGWGVEGVRQDAAGLDINVRALIRRKIDWVTATSDASRAKLGRAEQIQRRDGENILASRNSLQLARVARMTRNPA